MQLSKNNTIKIQLIIGRHVKKMNIALCGEMTRSIFLQKEGRLIELGAFSSSYEVLYNYVNDSRVLGILIGLIAN